MSMSTRGRTTLPDIDDDLLRARLQPLADRVLPGRSSGAPGNRPPASEAVRQTEAPSATSQEAATAAAPATVTEGDALKSASYIGIPEFRNADIAAVRTSAQPRPVQNAIAAAERIEQTRAARGPRKGVEFLLPDRVVQALRMAAAQDGVTMSVKLLEVLRNAGYPVIDEDFIDLRRLPKR